MDELDLSKFQHGGVNITGFRAVISTPQGQEAQKEWSLLNPRIYKGAGPGTKINVSAVRFYLQFVILCMFVTHVE